MKKLLTLALGIFSLISSYSNACTGITIKNNENIVQARTIEYGEENLKSHLIISPRNHQYKSFLPNSKNFGLTWKAKYGYVGISVINENFIGEGINEAGLNAGLFYFPYYGSLDSFTKAGEKKSLADMQLVSWILSNFSTVEEVKKAIKKIKVVPIAYQPDGQPLPTAHWRVSDKTGENIVIEIVENGKINIYDNKIGVLTNSPDYDWQVKNLNNYVNLYTGNAKSYKVNDTEIFSFGAGTGFLGLPGDITPPSRFVRAFFYLNSLVPVETNEERVHQAFQVMNNFDIPIGTEYPKEHYDKIPKDLPGATQWTAVSDLNNRNFYYKTMFNGTIRKIDLNKINFSSIKFEKLPLDKESENGIVELKIN